MNFEHSKAVKATSKAEDMPEGSGALTAKQLGLLRFRKEEVGITDEEYLTIVISNTGQAEDIKIPFSKVGDVLGCLDKLGEFKHLQKTLEGIEK